MISLKYSVRRKQKTTPNIQDLQKEIKEIKLEIKELKEKQKNDSETIQLFIQKQLEDNSDKESVQSDGDNEQNVGNIESIPDDFLFALKQITTRKYLIKITLIFSKDFKIDTITLFDTGADLNCIKEDIVPKKFHEKTKERLSAANNSKLNVKSKVDASIPNNGFEFQTSFLITNYIHHVVILGTPFINLITPYTVNYNGVSFKGKNQKLVFPFIEKPKTRNLNIVKACSVYQNQINAVLKSKQNNLFCLKKDLDLQRIENQLQNDFIQRKISDFKSLIEKEICADLPYAFWNRKQHMVYLPYENSFDEKKIPTKARPI